MYLRATRLTRSSRYLIFGGICHVRTVTDESIRLLRSISPKRVAFRSISSRLLSQLWIFTDAISVRKLRENSHYWTIRNSIYIELSVINFASDKCKFLSPSSFRQASELSNEKSMLITFDHASVSSSSFFAATSFSVNPSILHSWSHGPRLRFNFVPSCSAIEFQVAGRRARSSIMGIMNRCDESKKLEAPAKEIRNESKSEKSVLVTNDFSLDLVLVLLLLWTAVHTRVLCPRAYSTFPRFNYKAVGKKRGWMRRNGDDYFFLLYFFFLSLSLLFCFFLFFSCHAAIHRVNFDSTYE